MKACCIDDANGPHGIADDTPMSHYTTGNNGMGAANNDLATWLAAADQIRLFNNGGGPAWGTLDTDIRIVVARPFIECARPNEPCHATLAAFAHDAHPSIFVRAQAPDALGHHDQERPRDGRHAVRIPRPRTAAARAPLTPHAPVQVRPGGHAALGQHPSQEWDRSTFESPNHAPMPGAHSRPCSCAAIEGHYTGHFKAVVTCDPLRLEPP